MVTRRLVPRCVGLLRLRRERLVGEGHRDRVLLELEPNRALFRIANQAEAAARIGELLAANLPAVPPIDAEDRGLRLCRGVGPSLLHHAGEHEHRQPVRLAQRQPLILNRHGRRPQLVALAIKRVDLPSSDPFAGDPVNLKSPPALVGHGVAVVEEEQVVVGRREDDDFRQRVLGLELRVDHRLTVGEVDEDEPSGGLEHRHGFAGHVPKRRLGRELVRRPQLAALPGIDHFQHAMAARGPPNQHAASEGSLSLQRHFALAQQLAV